MHNIQELPTCKPQLKDFVRGEVNKVSVQSCQAIQGPQPYVTTRTAPAQVPTGSSLMHYMQEIIQVLQIVWGPRLDVTLHYTSVSTRSWVPAEWQVVPGIFLLIAQNRQLIPSIPQMGQAALG